MRVSFDFDSTLDRGDVQFFVKAIKKRYNADVWIVTSRVSDDRAPTSTWNNDLWFVCRMCNIPRENVVFTSYSSKHEFFWADENKDFLFHLDDDDDEIKMLKVHCPHMLAVNHLNQKDWMQVLNDELKNKLDNI